jgi:hypothetical protein
MGPERNPLPMNGIDLPAAFWLLLAVQVFGVCSACAARLSEGFPCQVVSRWIFLAALPLMGAATCLALAIGPGTWLACATSLTVMVLATTWDLRTKPDLAVW